MANHLAIDYAFVVANIRDDLAAAGTRYQHARTEQDAARDALRPLVEAALRDGLRQAEIVRLTGYTRENVRQIARAIGITADGVS